MSFECYGLVSSTVHWRSWQLVIGVVKFRWPLVIAGSVLFTVFFHYEIRYTHSIWIEVVGGMIIWVACTIAYVFLFEKKISPRN